MNNHHLRVYSYFDFLNSTIDFDSYLKFLKQNNYKVAPLTSVNNVFGLIKFIIKAEKSIFKPIVGLTLTNLQIESNSFEITVYSQNFEGLSNLFNLSSIVMNQSDFAISLEELKKNSKNLFCILSLNEQSTTAKIALAKKNLIFFGKELFLGITSPKQNYLNYLKFFEKSQIIIFYPIRYLFAGDQNFFNFLNSISNKNSKSHHWITVDELKKNKDQFELIDNIKQITTKINLDFLINQKKKNQEQTENSLNEIELIENFCLKQLNLKFKNQSKYLERFQYEFEIIKNKKLIHYFFIVWDYVKFAKKKEILIGPGRGSASGSLVSYLLGITKIDPLEFGLLFERFLNPGRTEMPDIDLDFEDEKKEEIVDYIFDKYPVNFVTLISIFQRIGIKMALRDAGRVLKIPIAIINQINKTFPIRPNFDYQKLLMSSVLLKKFRTEYQKLFTFAEKLVGFPRQIGVHAVGLIVSSQPLNKLAGIWSNNGRLVIQVDMNLLNSLNLIKMDILGLKKLTLIANLLPQIGILKQKNTYLEKIDLNKKEVFESLEKGETIGVFQLESKGMINLLQKIKPKKIEDIAIVMSLFRPGPLQNINLFLANEKNEKKLLKLFPPFIPILSSTRGIPIYQEQILKMIQVFSGLDYGASEIFRKAITKKNFDLVAIFKKTFVEKSLENGRSLELIAEIWKNLEGYASYGFNLSHALSYSFISYIITFFKIFHFQKFISLLLNSVIGDAEKTQEYIFLAFKKKLLIAPPNINKNLTKYQLDGEKILLPLIMIKKIGTVWINKLKNEREVNGSYSTIFKLVARLKLIGLTPLIFEHLVYSGALDCFKFNRPTLLANIKCLFLIADLVLVKKTKIDWSLLSEFPKLIIKKNDWLVNWQNSKKAFEFQTDYQFLTEFAKKNVPSQKKLSFLSDLAQNQKMNYFNCVFFVEYVKKILTKNQEEMAFSGIVDQSGALEVVIFTNIWKQTEINPGDLVYALIKKTLHLNHWKYSLENIIKIKSV